MIYSKSKHLLYKFNDIDEKNEYLMEIEFYMIILKFLTSKINGEYVFYKYIILILTSNDYQNDIDILFNDMYLELRKKDINYELIQDIENILFNKKILKLKNGKYIHKIKSQFDNLINEGKKDLINKIIKEYINVENIEDDSSIVYKFDKEKIATHL